MNLDQFDQKYKAVKQSKNYDNIIEKIEFLSFKWMEIAAFYTQEMPKLAKKAPSFL